MTNPITTIKQGINNTKSFFYMTDKERLDFYPKAKEIAKHFLKFILLIIFAFIFVIFIDIILIIVLNLFN